MLRTAIVLSALVAQAAAHGYINTFTLDGTSYEGFAFWHENKDPNAIGWSFTTQDEGPVLDPSSPDVICRTGSLPAKSSGTIAAGKTVDFFWTSDDKQRNPDGWSEGHRGPIVTYIAPCNGDCSTVDKMALRWTKIAEMGVEGKSNTEGTWATDVMRANGGINSARIPESIAPGNYVIRNEIIALHRAHLGEPEFYQQCGSIKVTGGGTDKLAGGVPGTELYKRGDKQIFGFDVYGPGNTDWKVPGPPLYTRDSDSGEVPDAGTQPPAGSNQSSAPVAGTSSVPALPAPTPVDGAHSGEQTGSPFDDDSEVLPPDTTPTTIIEPIESVETPAAPVEPETSRVPKKPVAGPRPGKGRGKGKGRGPRPGYPYTTHPSSCT